MKNEIHNRIRMKSLQRILELLPPKRMKISYKVVFYLLFVFAILLSISSYFSLLGCDSQAARLIQILTGLAIAITAVIALSAADPKIKKINADIEHFIAEGRAAGKETYLKKDLSDELKEFYKNCSESLTSYRVQFKITNTSNFDWVKPVVTFWLPDEKRHPQGPQQDGKSWTTLAYRSNTYNTQVDLKTLEMVDGVIISNSNLPYWREDRHITIWIRMLLENGGSDPFDVEVSVDCENAEGFTKKVTINPQKLLSDVGEKDEE